MIRYCVILLFSIAVSASAQSYLGKWQTFKLEIVPDSAFYKLDTSEQKLNLNYAKTVIRKGYFYFSEKKLYVQVYDSASGMNAETETYHDSMHYWSHTGSDGDTILLEKDTMMYNQSQRPDGFIVRHNGSFLVLQPLFPSYMRIWLRRED